jgi:hypothetical protein
MNPRSTLIGDISFPSPAHKTSTPLSPMGRGVGLEHVDQLFGSCARQVNIGSSISGGMKKQEASNKLGPVPLVLPCVYFYLLLDRLRQTIFLSFLQYFSSCFSLQYYL